MLFQVVWGTLFYLDELICIQSITINFLVLQSSRLAVARVPLTTESLIWQPRSLTLVAQLATNHFFNFNCDTATHIQTTVMLTLMATWQPEQPIWVNGGETRKRMKRDSCFIHAYKCTTLPDLPQVHWLLLTYSPSLGPKIKQNDKVLTHNDLNYSSGTSSHFVNPLR